MHTRIYSKSVAFMIPDVARCERYDRYKWENVIPEIQGIALDEDGHVPIDLVPELLHKAVQSVAVLFDRVISFRDNVFPESLPKALCLRVVPDETGTLKSLVNDLSDDTAHRFNFFKTVILSHEAVNFSQFLEKTENRLVALCLRDYDCAIMILDAADSTPSAIFAYGCTSVIFSRTASIILMGWRYVISK